MRQWTDRQLEARRSRRDNRNAFESVGSGSLSEGGFICRQNPLHAFGDMAAG